MEAASRQLEWTRATRCPEIHYSHLFCHKANQYQFTSMAYLQTKNSIKHQKSVYGKIALEKLLSYCGQKEYIRFSSTTILWNLRPPDGGPRCPRQKKAKKKNKTSITKHCHSWLSRDFTGRQSVSAHYCPELRPAAIWKGAEQIASEGSEGSRRPVGVITGGKCQCLRLAAERWRSG